MYFVGAVVDLNCSFARGGGEDAWYFNAIRTKMVHEAVFFSKAFGVADRAGVALDEDISLASLDDACSREGARAGG